MAPHCVFDHEVMRFFRLSKQNQRARRGYLVLGKRAPGVYHFLGTSQPYYLSNRCRLHYAQPYYLIRLHTLGGWESIKNLHNCKQNLIELGIKTMSRILRVVLQKGLKLICYSKYARSLPQVMTPVHSNREIMPAALAAAVDIHLRLLR